ncbi:vomeronasal type-2 receptor 116-like isoform X1 [Hyla sarda]|uniref:vomeronasal type-2 receptor 116-like isoform X1 n=1 Tax=Hyla sarda TaxID=327740 RepID=UPI0024C374B1|nr:vomeronasal type-2 receptor 116-like isoform X1 [Hyla sarda]
MYHRILNGVLCDRRGQRLYRLKLLRITALLLLTALHTAKPQKNCVFHSSRVTIRWKLLKITVLLLLSALHTAKPQKNCALHSLGDTPRYFKHGDVMLAGIFQFSYGSYYGYENKMLFPPQDRVCTGFNIQYLRHFLAFDFAIKEINKDPDILPNITLGYDIYDTCYFPEQAMQATMRALSGGVKHHWNYRCGDNGKIIAFIGHLLPTPSEAISQILNLYGYPQISYGESLNNKINFKFFYRTAHGPNVVNKVIIKLLNYFSWTWIGLITGDEDDLLKASENLKEESLKSGICVEYFLNTDEFISKIYKKHLKTTNARTLVLNASLLSIEKVLKIFLRKTQHNLIFTKDILTDSRAIEDRYIFYLEEVLLFVPQKGNIIGLKKVLQKANPVDYPNNKMLQHIWLSYFRCEPPDNKVNKKYWCRKNHTLESLSNMEYDVDNFRTTYSVYLSVYAVAHALNNMNMADNKDGKHHGSFLQRIHAKQERFSSCSETCFPGYRRAVNPILYCCHLCVPCPTGEYSNGNDADICEQCPEDEWPNSRNTACAKRPVDFLSFQNLLGSLLTSLIVILFIFSMIILIIFIKYRKTPIVKANNRNLSYTILISLMLCFLCSLLFIGNPDKVTCLLQNIIFNLVFAVALSSILAKTITVLIAFNVTKLNNQFKILFRKISQVFIIFCLIGEFGICMCWIQLYPPYPDRDSVSKPEILILHCNVGSHVIFYLALGYNSFLALLCFLVAYFAKTLPDRFNEAHHITFSMLVFCSVWISFIPAYISTKGKYMTAVQVFAILASSAGLLGFIFFPKCFIIIFRPELNVKQSLYIRSK